MQERRDKVALIIGATGGIGPAICQRLADGGAGIVTTSRNEEKARAWAAEQPFDPLLAACEVGD